MRLMGGQSREEEESMISIVERRTQAWLGSVDLARPNAKPGVECETPRRFGQARGWGL